MLNYENLSNEDAERILESLPATNVELLALIKSFHDWSEAAMALVASMAGVMQSEGLHLEPNVAAGGLAVLIGQMELDGKVRDLADRIVGHAGDSLG